MTTGRINQVTTFRPCALSRAQLPNTNKTGLPSWSGVHQFWLKTQKQPAKAFRQRCHTSSHKPATEPPCSPVSQISSQLLPVTRATEIMTFRENYQIDQQLSSEPQQSWRILKWLTAHRTGHWQVIHITSPIASSDTVLDLYWHKSCSRHLNCQALIHPMSVLPVRQTFQ